MEHLVNHTYSKTVYQSELHKQVECKSSMFEMLLMVAQDTVTSFKSDFYHDACFINAMDTSKAFEFYYLFGESGTTIVREGQGTLSSYGLAMQCRKYGRKWVYKVELKPKEDSTIGAYTLSLTCLATDKEDLPPYHERISFNYQALYEQNKVS